MKHQIKHTLAALSLAAVAIAPAAAQTQKPILEFHTQMYDLSQGGETSLYFELGAITESYFDIDFGFGPMEYKVGTAQFDSQVGEVAVYSLSGSKVGEAKGNAGVATIDLFSLQKGVYLVNVNGVHTEKIFVN